MPAVQQPIERVFRARPRPLTRREKREIKAALAETPRPTRAAIARRVGRPRRTVDRYIETLQGRV